MEQDLINRIIDLTGRISALETEWKLTKWFILGGGFMAFFTNALSLWDSHQLKKAQKKFFEQE